MEDGAGDRKLSGGQIASMERSNQLLPWRTDLLSQVMFDRLTQGLCGIIDERMKQGASHFPAAAVLAASLFTGRPIEAFTQLSMRWMHDTAPAADCEPGLYHGHVDTVWWLGAGAPSSRQDRSAAAADQARRTGSGVILRCGFLTERLMQLSIESQGLRVDLSHGPVALFQPHVVKTLAADCAKLLQRLARRHDCTVTLKKIESWLFQRVIEETGDPATASIITGKTSALSHATLHYASASHSRARAVHARIVTLGDTIIRPAPESDPPPRNWDDEVLWQAQPRLPAAIETVRLGSKFVPKPEEVQRLSTRLRASLDQARTSQGHSRAAEIHRAFTLYTIAAIGFATGMRAVRDPIPSLTMADRTTGFVVIDDKGGKGGSKSRLSWLAPAALEQVARYERHLRTIEALLPATGAAGITAMRAQRHDRLPVFFIKASGEIRPARVKDVAAAFAEPAIDFHLPMNAWRHYVRAELLMNVPGDVLHAFLGHWHRGQEPWSEFSALDPVVYKANLASVLTPMLARDGWEPEWGLGDEQAAGSA